MLNWGGGGGGGVFEQHGTNSIISHILSSVLPFFPFSFNKKEKKSKKTKKSQDSRDEAGKMMISEKGQEVRTARGH